MADRVTVLLEQALNAKTDAEKLACLKKINQTYRGTGVNLPNAPVQTMTKDMLKESLADKAKIRDLSNQVASLISERNQLQTDNIKLLQELKDMSDEMSNVMSRKKKKSTIDKMLIMIIVMVVVVLTLIVSVAT